MLLVGSLLASFLAGRLVDFAGSGWIGLAICGRFVACWPCGAALVVGVCCCVGVWLVWLFAWVVSAGV